MQIAQPFFSGRGSVVPANADSGVLVYRGSTACLSSTNVAVTQAGERVGCFNSASGNLLTFAGRVPYAGGYDPIVSRNHYGGGNYGASPIVSTNMVDDGVTLDFFLLALNASANGVGQYIILLDIENNFRVDIVGREIHGSTAINYRIIYYYTTAYDGHSTIKTAERTIGSLEFNQWHHIAVAFSDASVYSDYMGAHYIEMHFGYDGTVRPYSGGFHFGTNAIKTSTNEGAAQSVVGFGSAPNISISECRLRSGNAFKDENDPLYAPGVVWDDPTLFDDAFTNAYSLPTEPYAV